MADRKQTAQAAWQRRNMNTAVPTEKGRERPHAEEAGVASADPPDAGR